MTSIYPLILLIMFLHVFYQINEKNYNKVIMISIGITILCAVAYLISFKNELVSPYKLFFIVLSLFFMVELLINYFNEKIGNNNG